MESKRIFPKPVTDESPKKSPFRKEAPVKPAPAKKAAKTVEPDAAAAPAPAPTPEAETGNSA